VTRIPGWPAYLDVLKASGLWNADDPESQARLSREWQTLFDQQYARDEAPVVDALRGLGLQVGSIWDYVNGLPVPDAALPVLFEHLFLPYPTTVLAGIARSLADRRLRPEWPRIFTLFKETTDARLKGALAMAIAYSARPEDFDVIADLLRNPDHGGSRAMFLDYLRRSRDPRVPSLLGELLKDAQIRAGVEDVLRLIARRKKRQY
jgi:hypothetical protein